MDVDRSKTAKQQTNGYERTGKMKRLLHCQACANPTPTDNGLLGHLQNAAVAMFDELSKQICNTTRIIIKKAE